VGGNACGAWTGKRLEWVQLGVLGGAKNTRFKEGIAEDSSESVEVRPDIGKKLGLLRATSPSRFIRP